MDQFARAYNRSADRRSIDRSETDLSKTNPRTLVACRRVREDGADMIEPAFKTRSRPLLTSSRAKLSLSRLASPTRPSPQMQPILRGVETDCAVRKLFPAHSAGTDDEAYDKLAYNIRTRAFFEALKRGLINSEELETAENELGAWFERDRQRFLSDEKKV